MKGTVRFPIASLIALYGLLALLPKVRIPLIYNNAYRVGAWIGRTFPPAFAVAIIYALFLAWFVFIAASYFCIWGWRPFKKKSAAKSE